MVLLLKAQNASLKKDNVAHKNFPANGKDRNHKDAQL
ncbi:MAG: hypothetical protein CM15mP111_4020 [Hyphomicrobiales bacterium]|nr:MAG: hypothetical protein CM15mP111_4020 [Hyphomicrobiales bacterium]